MRRPKRLLYGALAFIVVLGVLGYCFDRVATARDRRTYPAKGDLVTVNGRAIHLYCTGEGTPSVVLDAGGFDSLDQWQLAQPVVARMTRVCSYDRPGYGWSDRSRGPQDAKSIAAELHAALLAKGVSAPYVVVGHSVSGLYARAFAAAYPAEVVGMVLDDSVHPDELREFPSHFPHHPLLFGALRLTAPLGIPRLIHFCKQTGARPDCSRFVRTVLGNLSDTEKSYAEVSLLGGLGSTPLVVLAHDPAVGLDKRTNASLETSWSKWQTQLSKLSSNSVLIVVKGAGHEIQTEQPAVVADAIKFVIAAARSLDHKIASINDDSTATLPANPPSSIRRPLTELHERNKHA